MIRRRSLVALALLCAPIALAGQAPKPAADARPLFADVTAAANITFVHASGATPDKFMFETFGSGVAWLDYDNDGFQDLYFVNGAPDAPNALYHNNHDGTFTDVTAKAGVAAVGGPHLQNRCRGRRLSTTTASSISTSLRSARTSCSGTTVTARSPTSRRKPASRAAPPSGAPAPAFSTTTATAISISTSPTTSTSGLDENPYCGFRRDGYRMYCNPTMFDGMADRLFRNNGDGTFTDVSKAAGIANPAGKGLGVTFCDYDRDGDPDIYVANDMVRNFLYRNNGDGTFTDVAYGAGVGFDANGKPQAGMGVDCADVDGNGLSGHLRHQLLRRAEHALQEPRRRHLRGRDDSGRPWLRVRAARLRDEARSTCDNDGDLDIYVTNGHVIDNVKLYQPKLTYAQKDLLYENLGGGRFRDISVQAGPALQATRVGRGLAVADFDNDGKLDVVISSVGRAPVLLRNQSVKGGNWLTIKAEGTKSNRYGLGATVTVTTAAGVQVREINNVASYLSSNDIRLHVGLGAATTVQQIEIAWPSGTKQTLTDVAANQILTVKEP